MLLLILQLNIHKICFMYPFIVKDGQEQKKNFGNRKNFTLKK